MTFCMPGAALDDDEAVGLLNHHADQADRRLQVVPPERRDDVVLGLDDGQRAHRLVAVLEPRVATAAIGARRPLDDAAALALLRSGDALRLDKDRTGQERGHDDHNRDAPARLHRHRVLRKLIAPDAPRHTTRRIRGSRGDPARWSTDISAGACSTAAACASARTGSGTRPESIAYGQGTDRLKAGFYNNPSSIVRKRRRTETPAALVRTRLINN